MEETETTAIEMLNTKIEALSKRVDELESILFDDLLNPMNEFVQEKERETAVNEFGEKHPDIAALKDDYSVLYDNSDVTADIYDAFKESGYDDEDKYVAEAVQVIADAIAEAKKKLGVNVEVEPTEEGVEVKVEEPAKEDNSESDEIADFEKELEKYL